MKTFRWKHSPQLALTLKGLTETERKGGGGREGEGTGGSCWVSADGLTQFQGTQWSQRLISKRQIVILVSSMAPVWWVHLLCSCAVGVLGGRLEPEERTALCWGPVMGENWKWNCNVSEMHWNENWAGSYCCLWNPFIQALNWFWPDWGGTQVGIEWIDPDNDAVAPVTNQEPPQSREYCHQSLGSQPQPTTLPYTPAHAPILHLNYFLILHTMSCSSCSAPITKLSAQIEDEAHLTAAKHFNKHTNMQTVLCKQNM